VLFPHTINHPNARLARANNKRRSAILDLISKVHMGHAGFVYKFFLEIVLVRCELILDAKVIHARCMKVRACLQLLLFWPVSQETF
jgi:hypothetical protein